MGGRLLLSCLLAMTCGAASASATQEHAELHGALGAARGLVLTAQASAWGSGGRAEPLPGISAKQELGRRHTSNVGYAGMIVNFAPSFSLDECAELAGRRGYRYFYVDVDIENVPVALYRSVDQFYSVCYGLLNPPAGARQEPGAGAGGREPESQRP